MSRENPRFDIFKDSFPTAAIKLADANPGAAVAIAETAKVYQFVDPESALGAVGMLVSLDEMDITGWKIWELYSRLSSNNPAIVIGHLRAVQLGLLDEAELLSQIQKGRPFGGLDDLMAKVKTELPSINLDFKVPAA